MAKITEVTDSFQVLSNKIGYSQVAWYGVPKKLQLIGTPVYMIEFGIPPIGKSYILYDQIVPWLNIHAGERNLAWVTHCKAGVCFIKDYGVALQFHLTFGSDAF